MSSNSHSYLFGMQHQSSKLAGDGAENSHSRSNSASRRSMFGNIFSIESQTPRLQPNSGATYFLTRWLIIALRVVSPMEVEKT
jgi:hypothetical protein